MLAFKGGDTGAFDALVEKYQVPLVNYFLGQSWDAALAEDCAQEVFVRLYTHREGYEPSATFRTYLYRIAHNLWIDHIRRRNSRPSVRSLPGVADDGQPSMDLHAARDIDPSGNMVREETGVAVQAAISGLDDEHREVFLLGHGRGLGYDEISSVLGIPVGTVKSRMFHAVRKLRESLKDHAPDAEGPQ